MRDKSHFSENSAEEFRNPSRTERPISGIVQEMLDHVTEIIRAEFRLARAEIRQDVSDVAKASLWLLVSGLLALYAFGFILLAAVYGLQNTVPPWAAALIVGAVLGVTAVTFLSVGRRRMKAASLVPEKTIQSLQENVTWVKKQTR